MYPFIRLFYQLYRVRRMPRIGVFDRHISHHYCLPWDIDLWMELNNGRTLTLYDLCRVPMAVRAGLVEHMKANSWGLTVAGVSVRYRRRVRMFDRVEMHARVLGWDEKFLYLEQSMWKANGDCAGQGYYRTAVTDSAGIVSPQRVAEAMGIDPTSPPLPDGVAAWARAEDARAWPPSRD